MADSFKLSLPRVPRRVSYSTLCGTLLELDSENSPSARITAGVQGVKREAKQHCVRTKLEPPDDYCWLCVVAHVAEQ